MTCHHARQPPPGGSPEEFRARMRAAVRLLARELSSSDASGWQLSPEVQALVQEHIDGLEDLINEGALSGPRLKVAAPTRAHPAPRPGTD